MGVGVLRILWTPECMKCLYSITRGYYIQDNCIEIFCMLINTVNIFNRDDNIRASLSLNDGYAIKIYPQLVQPHEPFKRS